MARQSKSERIRELLKQGVAQKDIVKKLNVSAQLVSIVNRNMMMKDKTSKKTTVKQKNDSEVGIVVIGVPVHMIASLKKGLEKLKRAYN